MSLSYDTALEMTALAGLVLTAPDLDAALLRVTEVAVQVVGPCDGSSMSMRRSGMPDTPAADADWSRALDEIQFAEQEGPCMDCLREGAVMRVRDFAADERFPAYGPRAAELGARSALSLPLAADGRTVGALNLYSRNVDAFDREALTLGELLAAHATLALQAAIAFYSSRELAGQLRSALASRASIEQAKGVLVGQRGITPEQAFEELVTRSQHSNTKLREVAAQVLREAVDGRGSPPG